MARRGVVSWETPETLRVCSPAPEPSPAFLAPWMYLSGSCMHPSRLRPSLTSAFSSFPVTGFTLKAPRSRCSRGAEAMFSEEEGSADLQSKQAQEHSIFRHHSTETSDSVIGGWVLHSRDVCDERTYCTEHSRLLYFQFRPELSAYMVKWYHETLWPSRPEFDSRCVHSPFFPLQSSTRAATTLRQSREHGARHY